MTSLACELDRSRSETPEQASRRRGPAAVRVVLLALGVFAVLALRRPDQLLHPYLWVEDGTVLLPEYLAVGWRSIFSPVNGYLELPTRLLFVLATKLSFLHQPTFAYWLTVLFTALVIASVAFSPTTLRFPALCAGAALLVPTDPEVFAVSEYAFWWGTLLAVVPLFWREDAAPRLATRVPMVLLGGLSSPLILGLSALYLARLVRRRSRANLVVLVTALGAGFVQWRMLARAGALSGPRSPAMHLADVSTLVAKFFGWFVYLSPSLLLGTVAGALLLAILLATAVRHRRDLRFEDALLVACLLLAIAASIRRVGIAPIHPTLAGPRYFFLPFLFLSWILLQLLAVARAPGRVVIALVLLLALRQTALYGRRFHHPFDWEREVMACSRAEVYSLPVHYTGVREEAWAVKLPGAVCRRLMSESLFDPRP